MLRRLPLAVFLSICVTTAFADTKQDCLRHDSPDVQIPACTKDTTNCQLVPVGTRALASLNTLL